MKRRGTGEEGLSIPEVLTAGFVLALSVAMTLAAISSIARASVNARYSQRSQDSGNRVLERLRAFGCGLMTGNETAGQLTNLKTNCYGYLGDSTTALTDPSDAKLSFRFTLRWVNPAVSNADCAGLAAAKPTLLERTVTVTAPTATGGTITRTYRNREAAPLDAAGYNLSGRGGIVVASTATVTVRPPATTGANDITHTGGPCAWFPFLVPGSYTVTNGSTSSNVTVTAPGQVLV